MTRQTDATAGPVPDLADPSAATARPETVRLSADLPAGDGLLLAEVAQATSANKTSTVVRAIRVLSELVKAERDGAQLTVQYPDGRRERLRFL